MATDDYPIDVQPDIWFIEKVLERLESGTLRVPRFQRPFVWRPEQVLDLFDSIERGYPIGSLLFWETTEAHASLDRIGDLEVPRPPAGRPISYVIDGHQRLSSLFATLRRPGSARRSVEQRDWMWWPYRVLGLSDDKAPRYRHWKSADQPPPNYLPIRSVLRTIDFLAYARELAERATPDMDVATLTSEAELVASRIKTYKLAVVKLERGTLNDIVEVFSRVNSTGQSMRPAEMVSALTYPSSGPDTLADKIDEMIEAVAETGFGEISADAVFRAVLAIAGEKNVQETRWDVLAHRVQDKLGTAVIDTDKTLSQVVEFLRETIGIPLARLIPYDAQLMLLMTFFHECPSPTIIQLERLTKWFWATSWTGYFAGANTTDIRNALREIREFAAGGPLKITADRARPFPDRFDLRSARLRAFIIWEMNEFPNRLTSAGTAIKAVDVFSRAATSAYRHVVTTPARPTTSSPANRLIMPTPPRVSVKSALLNLPDDLRDQVLLSHGIPVDALERLKAGDDEGFIEIRRTFLAEHERRFMRELGLGTSTDLVGETDIDTV
jgi:hypothetical protein